MITDWFGCAQNTMPRHVLPQREHECPHLLPKVFGELHLSSKSANAFARRSRSAAFLSSSSASASASASAWSLVGRTHGTRSREHARREHVRRANDHNDNSNIINNNNSNINNDMIRVVTTVRVRWVFVGTGTTKSWSAAASSSSLCSSSTSSSSRYANTPNSVLAQRVCLQSRSCS